MKLEVAAIAASALAIGLWLRRRRQRGVSSHATCTVTRGGLQSAATEKCEPVANIAVLGAGWWSQGWHLPHLSRHPHARIAAIVDPSPLPRSAISDLVSMHALGERYETAIFSSIDELLASPVANTLHGVLVCTTHASHAELGCKALARGLHVLVEKPMTTDVSEACQLAKAAEEASARSGATMMINNTANWRPQTIEARELVAGGAIGAVEHVLCVMHSPLLWLFDDPANEGWTRPTGTMVGNGFGYGQASHILAWALMVCDLTPQEAYCISTISERSGADMTDAAVLRCTNGASICFSGAGSVPGNAHADTTDENVHAVGKHIAVRVFGSEGLLTYEGDDQQSDSGRLAVTRRDGRHPVVRSKGFHFENYEPSGDGPESLHAFIDACNGKDAFVGVGHKVGLDVVRCLDAIYRSAKSGRPEPTCVEREPSAAG